MSNVSFSAYAALGSIKPAQVSDKPATNPAEKSGVAEGFSTFKAALQEAEQTAMQTAVSGADPHAMVEALAQAELVLDAAVTVRDKVVEAYQELLRMPVRSGRPHMTELAIFEVLRGALWAAAMMALPILAVTLVLGFVIGLLQALTSIQEMTLTFVPKILAVVVVFFLSLGYMTRICLDFFNNTVLPMISN